MDRPQFSFNCPLCGADILADPKLGPSSCSDKECPAYNIGSFEMVTDVEGVSYLVNTVDRSSSCRDIPDIETFELRRD